MAQDDRGVVFFGNSIYGLQYYTGTGWDFVEMPDRMAAFALAWDSRHQRLYAGSESSFGYYKSSGRGEYEFVDLTGHHEDVSFNWTRIREIRIQGDRVLVTTTRELLVWDGDIIRTMRSGNGQMQSLSLAGNDFWLFESGAGLYRGDRSGMSLTGFENEEESVAGVFEQGDAIVALTTGGVLYTRTNTGWESIFGADEELPTVDSAIRLQNGSFAVGTRQNGVYILDDELRTKYHITSDHGLRSNTINGLFEDRDGNVWVSTDVGVAMIEYASPFRTIRAEQLPDDELRRIAHYDGAFFAGGTALWQWNPDASVWNQITNEPNRVNSMRSTDHTGLLIGSSAGLFQYRSGRIDLVFDVGVYDIEIARSRQDRVYLIGGPELMVLDVEEDGTIGRELAAYDLGTSLFSVHEDSHGAVWLGTGNRGIIKLELEEEGDGIEVAEVRTFTTEDGLPEGGYNYTFQKDEQIYFITTTGTHYYDAVGDTVLPHEPHQLAYSGPLTRSWPVTEDDYNRLWIDFTGLELGYLDLHTEAPYEWISQPFRRHGPYHNIDNFVATSEDEIFTISSFGLSRFDLNRIHHLPEPPGALISSVVLGSDSLLSGPAASPEHALEQALAHSQKQLRFYWGSNSHLPESYRAFQTRLDGFDSDWTDWSSETRREYTNLPAGTYTFQVRTRDIYAQTGRKASITFRVLPPWYATVWAYLLYLTGLGLLFFVLLKWRTKRYFRRQQELETTVETRTREIERQKEKAESDRRLIAEQADELRKAEQMRAKLFANITHEFRTPLTISSGLVEKIRNSDRVPSPVKKDLDVISRNVGRLSAMINQIIDLTKMDNEAITLQEEVFVAEKTVRRISESFRSMAEARSQVLIVNIEESGAMLNTDVDKLETIINNLISNALKFTPDQGSIRVTAAPDTEKGRYVLKVEDTGPGIPDELAESVFNRFHRIRNEDHPYREGMGIGLELSRSFARIMEGDLTFESGREKGAEFTFWLPLYDGAEKSVMPADKAVEVAEEVDSEIKKARTSKKAGDKTLTDKPGNTHNVLLVEDNEDMRNYVDSVIEGIGTVRTAGNGAEALQIMKRWQPDIVISDLMMPGMNGYELIEAMNADKQLRIIPVIVLTAKAFQEDKLNLLRTGVVDYVTKPFNPEELMLRIQNALRAYAGRKEIRLDFKSSDEEDRQEQSKASQAAVYVREHIGDPNLTAEGLSTALNVSRRNLYRLIKAESGLTPAQFIREVRLQYARELLLRNNDLTTAEVALRVGFKKASWFAKVFREQFGMSPSEIK